MTGRAPCLGKCKKYRKRKLREVPYIHCFNHQLHLVVVHAMSCERALEKKFYVRNILYKYLRKPTVAAQYTGEKLKRLRTAMDWTSGHSDCDPQILQRPYQLARRNWKLSTQWYRGATSGHRALKSHHWSQLPVYCFNGTSHPQPAWCSK